MPGKPLHAVRFLFQFRGKIPGRVEHLPTVAGMLPNRMSLRKNPADNRRRILIDVGTNEKNGFFALT